MKEKLKQFGSQFGLPLILLFLCAYLILQLTLGIGDVVDTECTTYTSYTDTSILKAFIFRDETPLYSNVEGTTCYLVENGEKVSQSEAVAVSYASSEDAGIQEQILELDKMIHILEQSQISAGTTSDLSMLDEDITDKIVSMLREVADNDLSKVIRNEEALWIQMNRRQALLNTEGVSYETKIQQLKQEKEQLENSLVGEATRIFTSESGYFYSTVDGYETIFSMDTLNTLTVDRFLELSDSVADEDIVQNACGKLVHSSRWYAVTSISKKAASNFITDSKYSVYFPYSGGISLEMTLESKIGKTDSDVVVLVFSCNELPENFDFTRSQSIQLVLGSYSGIRIPKEALRVLDGVAGCYVLDGSTVAFKKVDIIYTTDEYAISSIPYDSVKGNNSNRAYQSAEYVSLYDTVILSGKNLYEGKVLK